jgi:glycosyl transferase, family 25
MSSPTRTFVISTADSIERRSAFAERAKNASAAWEFFDGCTKIAPGLTYDEARATRTLGRSLTANEIACYSSHYSLWKRLISDEVAQYIILEDDVIVDWKVIELIAETDVKSHGIELLRLYHKLPCPSRILKRHYLSRTSHLIQVMGAMAHGAQAYVITKAAAEHLLRSCREILRPVDLELDRFWEHGIPNLCIFPFPVIEEHGGSTIGNDRFSPEKKTVRMRAERRLRRAMDDIRRRLWLLRPPPRVADIHDPESWR